jgi:two-component system invasion response regulator UvrY
MMIIKGQKVPDIANVLNISAKTVNTYRYRMFEKLDVSSDVELTHLALRHKLITSEQF